MMLDRIYGKTFEKITLNINVKLAFTDMTPEERDILIENLKKELKDMNELDRQA